MARIKGMERRRTLVAHLAFFLSRRSYGRVITPARVYALDSGLLLAVGLMEEVQEWAKQTSAPVKQLARMLVAWRIGCPWCLDFGTSTSQKLGVTDEQLVALPDYEHSPLFSEEERAVLRYADAMTSTPVRVPNAVFEALKARYTDRQILEITAAVAWENFHARVNHALDHAWLPVTHWQVDYHHVVTAFGIPSEIIVAKRQPEGWEAASREGRMSL